MRKSHVEGLRLASNHVSESGSKSSLTLGKPSDEVMAKANSLTAELGPKLIAPGLLTKRNCEKINVYSF